MEVAVDAQARAHHAGITVEMGVVMDAILAMVSLPTTRPAALGSALHRTATVRAVALVAAMATVWVAIWAALVVVVVGAVGASRHVQLKAASPIRCAPALT